MPTYVGLETSGHVLLETTGGLLTEGSVAVGLEGVQVAFADPWDEPDPDWTRLDTLAGCRVRSWSIDRGRPNEFAKTGTGTATVNIVDRDGLFDPTNATSPYYPNVLPGKQAAISLWNPVSDTWHIRFRGFVEAWRYRLAPMRDHMELQLDLVDGFAMLARAELRVKVDGVTAINVTDGTAEEQLEQERAFAELAAGNIIYAETVGPVGRDRIQAILGDIEWPYEWRTQPPDPDPDIFTGNVRVGRKAYAPGTSALDALWDAADAEFPGVANLYCGADGHIKFRGRQARFRPAVAEYQITEYTVGDPSTTTGDPDAVPASELEWAIEDSQIYNACLATPQGVGTGDSWRELDPAKDDVAGQLVTDEPSRAAHGLQSLTFDNLQTLEDIATGEGALAATRKVAIYYVTNYSTVHVRITRLVFKARRPGADHGSPLWQFISNVEISDLLTVKTAHGGGGGFLTDFYVEGIHYTCRPGPPEHAIVELSLDVSPRAHWDPDNNPWPDDEDPA